MKVVLWVKKFLTSIGKPAYKTIVLLVKMLVNVFIWSQQLLTKLTGLLKMVRWGYFIPSLVLTLMTLFMLWLYVSVLTDLPDVNEIYNPPRLSTKILDRNGHLLYKFYDDENRTWVSLDKIPQSLIWATLAIEDKDFYKHHGISAKGIIGAFIYNTFRKEDGDAARGGSTITQQLVKKVFFSGEKTYTRKIKEAIISIWIETKLNKNEILERYFNQVPYGGDTYGVQEASWKYFGKNVWDLTIEESSFLAGLPAAPGSYSPFGSNPEYAYLRQKHVVGEMVSAKYITQEEGERILLNRVQIGTQRRDIVAPHFVFYVKDYLEKKFGYTDFERRGLTIKTSLDLEVQRLAEKVVAEEISAVSRLKITNGAAMVVDPKTGEILAMVGSKDYFAKDIDGKFNVATAQRQPGSSIKPINYLLALMRGWSLASFIDDSPVVYQVKGQSKPYIPQNYNGKYMGQVNLRTALGSSLNIPSVKLLAQNGIDNMIDLAEKMGITTWGDRSRFGLALSLGGGEVRMTELANAYSVFANMGEKTSINPVIEINNYLEETIYKANRITTQVVEPKYTYLINSALSDNAARAPVFGSNSKLVIRNHTVAVKTGTTNSLKDNWCIGWTPSILVVAWVGNNDSTPMSWVASGVSGATPIWSRIMTTMLQDKEEEVWPIPNGVYQSKICGKEEYFTDGNEAKVKCPVKAETTPTPSP